jgi:vacuolar-type H+-ATPase subunit I/STV1
MPPIKFLGLVILGEDRYKQLTVDLPMQNFQQMMELKYQLAEKDTQIKVERDRLNAALALSKIPEIEAEDQSISDRLEDLGKKNASLTKDLEDVKKVKAQYDSLKSFHKEVCELNLDLISRIDEAIAEIDKFKQTLDDITITTKFNEIKNILRNDGNRV